MATEITRTDTPSEVSVTGFAGAVNSALTEAGITRHAAAIQTGIPRETFYRKCRGIGAFDSDEQLAIATLLGVRVSDLWLRVEDAA